MTQKIDLTIEKDIKGKPFTKTTLLYKNKDVLHKSIESLIPEMIGAELRALIQNWRKANGFAIDQHIPVLKFWFANPIFKTVFVEGLSGVGENKHFLDLCLVDSAEYEMPKADIMSLTSKYDIVFWSPMGGTVGYGSPLHGNSKNIQKELDIVLNEKLYNRYYE